MNTAFPYQPDRRGRTGVNDGDAHLRDLIEQLLFTAPGERVMRPTFGSGVYQLVFAPASTALAATVQQTIHAALQQWLGELIGIDTVEVEAGDGSIRVEVRYYALPNGPRQTATFERTT
jgi:phage baseplate assembly protein W